jgi:hypothetical protein
MERGDIAAVIIAIFLVILLTALLPPGLAPSPPQSPGVGPAIPTPVPPATPAQETTTEPVPEVPTPSPLTATRITYTNDYSRYPVRFLPGDMAIYGFSDVAWQYSSSVAFAYVEENHGGITGTFTVPYPVWRMTTTVTATRTPENARFRMILVDEKSGLILEGVEIRFPGTVEKTVASRGRPLYMVIDTANVDRFVITLETPSVFAR